VQRGQGKTKGFEKEDLLVNANDSKSQHTAIDRMEQIKADQIGKKKVMQPGVDGDKTRALAKTKVERKGKRKGRVQM